MLEFPATSPSSAASGPPQGEALHLPVALSASDRHRSITCLGGVERAKRWSLQPRRETGRRMWRTETTSGRRQRTCLGEAIYKWMKMCLPEACLTIQPCGPPVRPTVSSQPPTTPVHLDRQGFNIAICKGEDYAMGVHLVCEADAPQPQPSRATTPKRRGPSVRSLNPLLERLKTESESPP